MGTTCRASEPGSKARVRRDLTENPLRPALSKGPSDYNRLELFASKRHFQLSNRFEPFRQSASTEKGGVR